jgi:hypothetical protein
MQNTMQTEEPESQKKSSFLGSIVNKVKSIVK